MKYETATPFTASYLIIRKDQKIAFLLRTHTKWMNGFYGLPSGKVEKHESFTAAAIREGAEEVGINLDAAGLKYVHTMHRFTDSEKSDWVDVFFEATKFKGEPFNAEPDVHGELAWLDPNNLPDNVVPSVKFALAQIEAGAVYSEYGWSNN